MHQSPNAMQIRSTWSNNQMHRSLMEMDDGSTQSINKMHWFPNAMHFWLTRNNHQMHRSPMEMDD
eukprot:5293468-Ditylum_brightwellii.AAC.1